MKLKKRPIFLEITKNSFFAIILILTIYTVSQLVVFWIFIDKHEIDLVKSRYQEIINLSNSINIEFSEKGFIEYLERLDYNENDEYIRNRQFRTGGKCRRRGRQYPDRRVYHRL